MFGFLFGVLRQSYIEVYQNASLTVTYVLHLGDGVLNHIGLVIDIRAGTGGVAQLNSIHRSFFIPGRCQNKKFTKINVINRCLYTDGSHFSFPH